MGHNLLPPCFCLSLEFEDLSGTTAKKKKESPPICFGAKNIEDYLLCIRYDSVLKELTSLLAEFNRFGYTCNGQMRIYRGRKSVMHLERMSQRTNATEKGRIPFYIGHSGKTSWRLGFKNLLNHKWNLVQVESRKVFQV